MTEPTAANLSPHAHWYRSLRPLWDVLVGEDQALPLVQALSKDPSELRGLLAQTHFTQMAPDSAHCICGESGSSEAEGNGRRVLAMRRPNLERLISKAASVHNAAAVTVLAQFASEHGIDPVDLVNMYVINQAIKNDDAPVMEALLSANPEAVSLDLYHDRQPLDVAVPSGKVEVIEVLLRHGADLKPTAPGTKRHRSGSYECSLLSLSTRYPTPRMAELLLQYGVPIAGWGALHHAVNHATRYKTMDTIRLLI